MGGFAVSYGGREETDNCLDTHATHLHTFCDYMEARDAMGAHGLWVGALDRCGVFPEVRCAKKLQNQSL